MLSKKFRIYLRMSSDSFSELLELVKPFITKTDTVMRKAVTAEERLVATLKYLASGREFRELKFGTSISSQLLSEIILETCGAICKVLKKVPAPATPLQSTLPQRPRRRRSSIQRTVDIDQQMTDIEARRVEAELITAQAFTKLSESVSNIGNVLLSIANAISEFARMPNP